jgi:hypothetical protein
MLQRPRRWARARRRDVHGRTGPRPRDGEQRHRRARHGRARRPFGSRVNGKPFGSWPGRRPAWWPDWSDRPCILVASGPGAAACDLAGLRERVDAGKLAILAVNDSWRLCPFASALYAADGAWWDAGHERLEPGGFAGLKLTQDAPTAVKYADVHLMNLKHVDRLLLETPGEIGSAGNSGFQAINVALQFGARRLGLVGYDLCLEGGIHWHGPHQGRLNNPSAALLAHWRQRLDSQATLIEAIGASLVTLTPSALQRYRRATLPAFLRG